MRPADVPAPAEEMEKKQKILLWLMEGQKELVQHKRSSYGSVLPSSNCSAQFALLSSFTLMIHRARSS